MMHRLVVVCIAILVLITDVTEQSNSFYAPHLSEEDSSFFRVFRSAPNGKPTFIRFGKRAQPSFIRFGRAQPSFIRFGRTDATF
ncbi:hypothetical protein KIN20_013155 [Parelaphostrongylus tenuis]|uniref:Uncharacterized protein n=1 Tax=Parelaphostrongylus tenuis TaxID=148309 RepID=A0AAD5QQU0_PARTN|nr:hypothetical protein KIN20_013155 [Parelaphostrongylus tenuis]